MTWRHSNRKLWFAGIALTVLLVAAGLLLALKWPFSQSALVDSIHEVVAGNVQVAEFHSTLLPHPGCVVKGVVVRRSPTGPPLIAVERLSIQARYADLLLRPGFIARILFNGLYIHIPPGGSDGHGNSSGNQNNASKIRVGEIVADGAVLQIDRQNHKPPLKFEIHSLRLQSVSRVSSFSFSVALTNALPPGEIISKGTFGPWNFGHFGQTPVSGSYEFRNADLGVFPGIGGMLSSSDRFEGDMEGISVHGAVKIPEFKVKGRGHILDLRSHFDATVNATNGDVFLHRLQSSFGSTTVTAAGEIAGHPGGKGKTTSIRASVNGGHIEDVLAIFARNANPAFEGVTTFNVQVRIPPGQLPFLKKVTLKSDFHIDHGHFRKMETQSKIDELSRRSLGEKDKNGQPPNQAEVSSTLQGRVILANAVATFTTVQFGVPGATAYLHGRYNISSESVDLHGQLATQAKLSQTTSGAKSILLKPLDVFFQRKHAGAQIPIKITGTYSDPRVGLDLAARGSSK